MSTRQLDSAQRLELLRSLTSSTQVIKEPRKGSTPNSISQILIISKQTNETRQRLSKIATEEISSATWKSQWYANHEKSIRLLTQFAEEQITSAMSLVNGWGQTRLKDYLTKVQTSHPFDSVINLLSNEPMLMLSNLGAEQVVAIYELCEQLNQDTTALRLYATALLVQES